MKFSINYLFLLVAASFLPACKKESGDVSSKPMLIGKWVDAEFREIIVLSPQPDTIFIKAVVSLNADGSYTVQDDPYSKIGDSGIWELTADDRNILFTPSKPVAIFPYSVRWQIDRITDTKLEVVEHTEGQLPGSPATFHAVSLREFVKL